MSYVDNIIVLYSDRRILFIILNYKYKVLFSKLASGGCKSNDALQEAVIQA